MFILDDNEFPKPFLMTADGLSGTGTTTFHCRPLLTAAIRIVRRSVAMAYTDDVVTNEISVVILVRPENAEGKALGHSQRLEVMENVIPRAVVLPDE